MGLPAGMKTCSSPIFISSGMHSVLRCRCIKEIGNPASKQFGKCGQKRDIRIAFLPLP